MQSIESCVMSNFQKDFRHFFLQRHSLTISSIQMLVRSASDALQKPAPDNIMGYPIITASKFKKAALDDYQ